MDQKTKFLITLSLILLILGLLFVFQSISVGKLRIIACDVVQGDGLLIISPEGKQIVVDGGPGSKMGACLSKYMPFWDKHVELMVSTHPQKDHMEGLVDVLARYNVKTIATTGVVNKTALFGIWKKAVDAEGVKMYSPNLNDQLLVDKSGLKITVLWPSSEDVERWKVDSPSDLNETSIVLRLEYGDFCAYLTGDIPKEILARIIDRQCDVLKVGHHGSRTGTDSAVVEKIKPKLALIQVGKNNRNNHPNLEVLDALAKSGVKILRNDLNGVIEVETDGKAFTVKGEK